MVTIFNLFLKPFIFLILLYHIKYFSSIRVNDVAVILQHIDNKGFLSKLNLCHPHGMRE